MDSKLNLSKYFGRYAGLYLIAVICTMILCAVDMIIPLIVQRIVDDVIVARQVELLSKFLVFFLILGGGKMIAQYSKEFICDWAGSKIASEVRINLFEKIQGLSANFFDKINSGELMSRVKDDVDSIWNVAAFMGILMAEVLFRTLLTLYFMIKINWQLAILPILGMVGAGFVAVFMEKRLDNVYGQIAQENSELNNTAAENLAGVRTVKAFAREGFEINKFHKHNQKYYELNIDQSKIFVRFNPIIQVITRFLSIATLLAGGFAVMYDRLTIGQLMALLSYVGNIVWPMEMLGWLTNGISQAKASVKRLNKIYAEKPEITDQSNVPEEAFSQFDIDGGLTFENVSYRVSGEDAGSGRYILQNVSFDLKAGQTLGVMGATGSGKTTIINLMKRMYDVTEGRILIDGVDIREIPLPTLRKSIAAVMQDVFLFSDTIEGNIRLGERDKMAPAAVRSALEKAQAWDFVSGMKEGVDTVIGERGVGLSGGQKQRITIARALARRTPILVLDDSTSALDTETEQDFQKVLDGLQGMTKIIIGHRISSVHKADKIIVLDGGKIAESGTHAELMALGGLYKETYDSQMGE